MKMIVEGMTCDHCVRTITRAIHQLDPSAQVDIDLGMEEVNIAGSITVDAMVAAIQEAGYRVVAILELGLGQTVHDEVKPATTCCGSCRSAN